MFGKGAIHAIQTMHRPHTPIAWLQACARWVDYIIGEGELAALDKDLLKRIEDIEKLDEATKQHLFFLIDNVIQNYKTKKAFNK